jgi:predicted Fe-Mo cluster-binding NifX family protein
MSKVAVMVEVESASSPMSDHFGQAEWIMIVGSDAKAPEFVRNEGANGKSVVEILTAQNCTDVIFTEIGEGARQQLLARHISGWIAPLHINAGQALQMLEQGKLQHADASTGHASGCGSDTGAKHCCGVCK